MHPCLRTPEILSQIFDYVYTAQSGPTDIATLAATCRAFHEPALYILWRYLPSLVPLVKCLPGDAYETEGDPFHRGRQTIVRRTSLHS